MTTALDRLVAAIDAGELPAPGTYRDAYAELDKIEDAAFDELRRVARLRASLTSHQTHSEYARLMQDVRPPAPPVLELVTRPGPTLCGTCGERAARFWVGETAYCGPCADRAGVRPHGKIGE